MSGRDELAFDQDRDRLVALMSVAANRPVAAAEVLPHVEAAAAHWQRGDKALANLRLVFAKQPRVSDQTAGGPLICMEERHASSWRGIYGLSISHDGVANDYERACEVTALTTIIPLKAQASALVLGDAPMDTIVRFKHRRLLMLRVMSCEEDFDGDEYLGSLDPSFFSSSKESLDFTFAPSPLALFDSACPGDDMDRPCIFSLEPGTYRVLTQYVHREPFTGIVHQFNHLR